MSLYENGYELYIWRGIYHGGKFSHNLTRREIVHAWTEQQARAIVQLAGEEETRAADMLVVKASGEYIHSLKCLGRVVHKYVVEYIEEASKC